MWRANKTPPSVPARASRGQGPGPQIQADSPDSVFSAKHKRVKFILGQCQLPSAALSLMGQAFGECREDISCIISCSSRAVSFWPCSWYASMLLSILLPPGALMQISAARWCSIYLSVCCSRSSTCFPPCFPSVSPTVHSRSVAGSSRGTLRAAWASFSPPSLQAACQMPPLHSFFDHTVKRECFLLLLDRTFKKPFLHPVCLRCTSDENSDRFFPTRSASSGNRSQPLAPLLLTHTHPHLQPPLWNTKYFILEAGLRGRKQRGEKEIQYILKTNYGCFDKCRLDGQCVPTGKVRGR